MRIVWADSFAKEYNKLPSQIQKQAERKLRIFLENPRHPSLRVKRVKGYNNLWEGSITMNYRFLFSWESDIVILRFIGTHSLVDKL